MQFGSGVISLPGARNDIRIWGWRMSPDTSSRWFSGKIRAALIKAEPILRLMWTSHFLVKLPLTLTLCMYVFLVTLKIADPRRLPWGWSKVVLFPPLISFGAVLARFAYHCLRGTIRLRKKD